jgi:hypothetical protein
MFVLFVLAKFFQPTLIFKIKAGTFPCNSPDRLLSLSKEDLPERLGRDKHSTLFCLFLVNKKHNSLDNRTTKKHFPAMTLIFISGN